MTAKQETFNRVIGGLLKQGCQSKDVYDQCMYRTADGRKCAAGMLIPDADYSPELEGIGVDCSPDSDNPISVLLERDGHNLELVKQLQIIHDNTDPACWLNEFRKCAATHGILWS